MNRGQEFVIGSYFPAPHGIDSLIVGYYDGDMLMYVARTRNGFVPASRRQVFSKLNDLVESIARGAERLEPGALELVKKTLVFARQLALGNDLEHESLKGHGTKAAQV